MANYETDPRAIILAKYNKFIKTEEDMKKWLTLNEEEDAKVGLAPRYDLAEKGNKLFGMTDTKIITPFLESQNYIEAINGPPTSSGRFAPFDWRNWPKDVY